MVWYTRLLVSKLAAAATSSSSTLFKKLSTTQNRPTLSKLGATSSSSVFKNLITTQNHPISSTLSKQKHSFSNHLVGFKSPPPLSISSKYLNNVFMVKRYNTYATRDPPEWLRKILETISRVTNHPDYLPTLMFIFIISHIIALEKYYDENSEAMLYTNRMIYYRTPPSADKVLAKRIFNKDKLGLLPEEHPDSVRVKSIGDQIVKALQSDIEAMKNKVKKLGVDHLVGLEWEFVVTTSDHTKFTSASVPGGKICVSSDLLKHLESDADIATIIGHEVGHIVARHDSLRLNRYMKAIDFANKYFGLSISSPKMAEHKTNVSGLGGLLFVEQRDEMEADYIGLLIMASAGFDPQEAPKVYAMLDQLPPSTSLTSGNERAEHLAQAKVMGDAKSIYSKTIESRKMNDDIKDI